MSAAGLKGMKDMSCALMANGPGGATNSMWPSAGAFTTRSTPILPFAPGRLSTTKGTPKLLLKSSASTRASRSTDPPGGLVAMMRTVWLGQGCCADAASGNAHAAASANVESADFIERDYLTAWASTSASSEPAPIAPNRCKCNYILPQCAHGLTHDQGPRPQEPRLGGAADGARDADREN